MINLRVFIFFVFIIFHNLLYAVESPCDVFFSDMHNITWEGGGKSIGYDAFGPATLIQELSFEVIRTKGNEACYLAIGVGDRVSTSQETRYLQNESEATGQDKLSYNLYLDRELRSAALPYRPGRRNQQMVFVSFGPKINIQDNIADTTSNTNKEVQDKEVNQRQQQQLRNLTLRRANTINTDKQEFKLYLHIPKNQLISPGEYKSELNFSIYEINKTHYELQDQASVDLAAFVKPSLLLAVQDTPIFSEINHNYHVDFSILQLEEPNSHDFYLAVKTNSRFKYKLESTNKGNLSMIDKPQKLSKLKTKIPYKFKIFDIIAPLDIKSDFITAEFSKSANSIDGFAIPLNITLDEEITMSNIHPGIYQDTILITIALDY